MLFLSRSLPSLKKFKNRVVHNLATCTISPQIKKRFASYTLIIFHIIFLYLYIYWKIQTNTNNFGNSLFFMFPPDSANCSLEYLRTFPKNASVYIGEDHTFECSPQESSWSVSWEKDGQRLDSHVTVGCIPMMLPF